MALAFDNEAQISDAAESVKSYEVILNSHESASWCGSMGVVITDWDMDNWYKVVR